MIKPEGDRQDVARIIKIDWITRMSNTLTARGSRTQTRVLVELLAALEIDTAQLNALQEKSYTLHGRRLTVEAILNALVADYLSLPAEERHAILANGLRSVEAMLDTAPSAAGDLARIPVTDARKSPRKPKAKASKVKTA